MAACATCGHENPRDNRFCGRCGAPLTVPADTEARKVVTVLFCDLVDFTAVSDGADPEDVRARVRPYHARLREEIERYGGTVEKFIGDAVMAVFGAPVVHEDDAERAVRAGLRILDAIAELNEQDSGLALSVRVGIETGEAIVDLAARVDLGEGMVTGDVVNTASRLQGAAPVNGVVVGEGTYLGTNDVFDYEPLQRVRLKGKGEPVAIFHAKAARARLGTDVTRTLTPFVGRELERDLLIGVFERSVHDRSVQLVTIVGEPGVGKSRLVTELLSFVDRSPALLVRWRQGRCLPYGDVVTFWALGEIVKAETGILETDPPDVAASKIDTAIPEGDRDSAWLRQRLRPLLGLDAPQAARDENFAAWRTFLESLAEERPSVFVFEDLHWADDALLSFLEHLARYAEGVPMLLVGTARPELFERASGFGLGARNAHRIDLAPLVDRETATLISNLLGKAVLPAEVQQKILSRCGGNPLFAEEFVRLLKGRQILSRRGEPWTIDVDADIPLPSGVQSVIAARLDTLPRDRRRLLQDASVVGKVFWSGALAEMGETDEADVFEGLHELSRAELVRPVRSSSMRDETEYSFLHTLVRDVCYAQIPRASRAERHRRAAAWIERVSGDRMEDHADILAAHYSTALSLAEAIRGSRADEFRSNAIRYRTLAGDRAMGIDVGAAERHYADALRLMQPNDPDRPSLLARHADALHQRGRFVDAARTYEEAIDGLRERGDVVGMATAVAAQSVVLRQLGDRRGSELAAQAVEALEPLGPSPALARALADAAGQSLVLSQDRATIAYAERAISLASELGLPEPARALGFRGKARVNFGDEGGFDDMRRAMSAAVAQGLGREVALLHLNLSEAVWALEGPGAWLDMLVEGSSYAARLGIEEFVVLLGALTTTALVELGRWDEAEAAADDLIPRFEGAGDLGLFDVRTSQLRIRTRRGDLAGAAPLAAWTVERAREIREPQLFAKAFPAACALAVASDDVSGALTLLRELATIEGLGSGPDYVVGLTDAVRAAIAASDLALAERLIGVVAPWYPMYEHALTTARAALAERRGDAAAAERSFAAAAEGWAKFGVPWEHVQALLGRARCLLELDRSTEATPLLREARAVLRSLGVLEPWLARTDLT
jgi:class 3 adenylate cyclase/tetratricopeptide (TPR) repeat protein